MIIAIDIGGTSIKYGCYVDGNLQDVKQVSSKASSGAEALFEQLCGLIKMVNNLSGIAISTAGQVDIFQGKIVHAGASIPNYTGFELKKKLMEIFKVPVSVENDVNCVALSEIGEGLIKDNDLYLCLTVGTGIGGSVIYKQKVLHGTTFSLGEFGYLPMKNSTFEKVASTKALVERVNQYNANIKSGIQIIQAIDDKKVREVVDEWIDDLVFGLYTLTVAFNPKYIIIGGGILDSREVLFELINNKYLELCSKNKFMNTKLKATTFFNHAGMKGAYINFLQNAN